MRTRIDAKALGAVLAVNLVAPRGALASNEARPRTPPTFLDQQCMAVVDRNVDPMFHLSFGLPIEEPSLSDDELPDSRTLQFFAMCRDTGPSETLPTWVTPDDAQRALDAGLIEELPADEQVLQLSALWQLNMSECVQPLNSATQRIPMLCEHAEQGIDWDTRGAPAGNYVIRGYSFEPPASLWTTRLGVVRVIDGDPSAIPPAVALTSPARDAKVHETSSYSVGGCVSSTDEMTTLTLEWAPNSAPDLTDPAAWTTLDSSTLSAGDFTFDFVPPPEAINQALVLRATVVDEAGGVGVGHAPGLLLVFPGDGETQDPPGEGPNICGDADDGTDGTGTDSGAPVDDPDAGTGCVCGRGGATTPWLLIVLFARRRR